ncbi:MAG: hypothetical protein JNM72_18040 [Deltaproteobacteria bacterium]|nr:hypothetical protein [Deltaproteobacteria bacterium]
MSTWAADGIDAAGLGADDLGLDPAWITKTGAAAGVPLVVTNLQCPGLSAAPSLRLERGGKSALILGLWSEGAYASGCTASPPAAAAAAALVADQAAHGGQAADLVIVLSQLIEDEVPAVARTVPALDLFLDGKGSPSTPEPRPVSPSALRLSSGSRGKVLGIATIRWMEGADGLAPLDAGEALDKRRERIAQRITSAERQAAGATEPAARARAEERLAYLREELERASAPVAGAGGARSGLSLRLVGLGADIADAPQAAAALSTAKAEIEAAGAAATPSAPRVGGPFAGAAACAGCHPGPHAQWATTSHAGAWTTLVDAQRSMDLACWGCHATGARQPGGPAAPAEVGALGGVQCEACHGPSAAHAANPASTRPLRAPGVEVCVRCHDGAQDGGRFDAATYLPKVGHGTAAAPAGG